MLTKTIILTFALIVSYVSAFGADYNVRLTNDGPVVKGSTINFLAIVYEDGRISDSTNFVFEWEDDAIPQHKRTTDPQNATDVWSVTYDADTYALGTYIVNVIVKHCIMILCYEVASARNYFNITGSVNGEMRLMQGNKTMETDYISNASTVLHELEIKKSDWEFIKKAPTLLTYWFIDCTYYGITTDMKFPFNYSMAGEDHTVEALLMADFTPLPTTTVPPTTTTTKTTTTTSKPTASTTLKPNTTPSTNSNSTTTNAVNPTSATSHAVSKVLKKRNVNLGAVKDILKIPNVMSDLNSSLESFGGSFPYICNGTKVATDSKKSYGYFLRRVKVKAPITKINVTGNNWIQHGDLLSLKVQCHGSREIEYCVDYKRGAYNVTGNETCYRYTYLDVCDFRINRYLSGSKYTVLIIIRNEVSKVVQPVTVTFYEVTTQPQLSVIVVPVAFSLVAVVLIVFGIAYYLQNRSRFLIEVADFNFGQQYSDLEYKTFRERLRDSIANAFTRGPTPSSSEVPVWPPGQKYGNMT